MCVSSCLGFLCVLLILLCMNCLYILEIKPLLVTLFANIFSHSLSVLSFFLWFHSLPLVICNGLNELSFHEHLGVFIYSVIPIILP